MAKKSEKIAVKSFKGAANVTDNVPTVVEWNGLSISVTKRLGLRQVLAFIDEVVNGCFSEESGEYMPEVVDFAIRCNVLTRYANFTLPTDVEEK